ncbi:hypothetical protein CALCODRAFT_57027 [Calocera cornea HHB12733]|uniref:Uncharacterized protein n=1 Tax=Calocera cornea HHB12733 TaxID=1353952 RepID=A0A165DPS9_9BASI|nr:hypothetical protein CALCODRAFT_57027 [Calocera cornea HHB12733]
MIRQPTLRRTARSYTYRPFPSQAFSSVASSFVFSSTGSCRFLDVSPHFWPHRCLLVLRNEPFLRLALPQTQGRSTHAPPAYHPTRSIPSRMYTSKKPGNPKTTTTGLLRISTPISVSISVFISVFPLSIPFHFNRFARIQRYA